MSFNPKFRTCIITAILLLNSIAIFIITPSNVKAQENQGETVLYFTQYNVSAEFEEISEVSTTPPEGKNYSSFPPIFSLKNEDWFNWFTLYILSKSLDLGGIFDLTEEELQELLNETGLTEDELLELFGFLNPFKMSEIYVYTGEEQQISGDIRFNLYFLSNLASKTAFKDEINVSILLNDEEIGSTSATIESKLLQGKIQKQTITISGVDFTLEDEDQLTFSIEMIPTSKPVGNIVENIDIDSLIENLDLLAEALTNQSYFPTLQSVGETIKDVINLTESGEFNLTSEDVADLTNVLRSSSFIFNSVDYQSSVTLPIKVSETENTVTYYLREGEELNEEMPTNEKGVKVDIKQSKKWVGPSLTRNKILEGATANLFISYRDLIRILNLGKTTVIASLKYGNITISESQVELKKTTIIDMLLRPIIEVDFTFEFNPLEIKYGEILSLEVSVANGTRFGLFGFYRSVKLVAESSQYPSSLVLNYEETTNIKTVLLSESEQEIIVGGKAEFTLNVTSKNKDTIAFDAVSKGKQGEWSFEIPADIDLSAGGSATVQFTINHDTESLDAYGDYIKLSLIATGKSGRSIQNVNIVVSDDAVEYHIEVIPPSGKEIKHGNSGIYTFIIANGNTGLWPDDYEIEVYSQHNWTKPSDIEYNVVETKDVPVGGEFELKVKVNVPAYTDICTDKLTVKITSLESVVHGKEKIAFINVTTTVILPNVLEKIYNFFATSAESLGLDSILGDYGALFLIAIFVFFIVFFLIIIIYILRIKYVDIICLERVKEIDPYEAAEFDITIHNPQKQALNYEINANTDSKPDRWEVIVDTKNIYLEPKESKSLKVIIKPTDFVKYGDWIEVEIEAKAIEKQKIAKITVIASLKETKPKLEIMGILHWPKKFKKGDVVKTSFRVENKGKVSANNVSVFLYLNGKEKNKVEDITIPRGGYADIEMPWIAVKGKNEINIVVK